MAYIRKDIEVISRFSQISIGDDGRVTGALLTGYYVGGVWNLIDTVQIDISGDDFMLKNGPGGVSRLERLHDELARKMVLDAKITGEVVSR